MVEGSIIIYNTIIDDPLLPQIFYVQVRLWSIKISPSNHVLMDHKEEREWCMTVINVKGNGLAMEGFQTLSDVVTVIYHEDILSNLVAIIKQHKGKEETDSRRDENE